MLPLLTQPFPIKYMYMYVNSRIKILWFGAGNLNITICNATVTVTIIVPVSDPTDLWYEIDKKSFTLPFLLVGSVLLLSQRSLILKRQEIKIKMSLDHATRTKGHHQDNADIVTSTLLRM